MTGWPGGPLARTSARSRQRLLDRPLTVSRPPGRRRRRRSSAPTSWFDSILGRAGEAQFTGRCRPIPPRQQSSAILATTTLTHRGTNDDQEAAAVGRHAGRDLHAAAGAGCDRAAVAGLRSFAPRPGVYGRGGRGTNIGTGTIPD